MNTPTLTWVYTRTIKERGGGEKRSVTRSTSVVFPMPWDAVYLKEKKKNRLRKIFTETTSQEKLKMRHWVNPNS